MDENGWLLFQDWSVTLVGSGKRDIDLLQWLYNDKVKQNTKDETIRQNKTPSV